jgi:hypothetical protein
MALEMAAKKAFEIRESELLESVFAQFDLNNESYLRRISFMRFLQSNMESYKQIWPPFARNMK